MKRRPIFRTGLLDTGRVEAFSDGVLAVALTLLVLDLRLPPHLADDAAVWAALWRLAPMIAAWGVSFAFILVFWVNHHYFFASLKAADRGLLWLNGCFLLTIALIPFPTGLVGEYPGFTAPLASLSFVMLMTSCSFALMRFYVSFYSPLLREHISRSQIRAAMARTAIAPVLYGAAFVLSFVLPVAAIALQLLVLVIFFLRSPIQRTDKDADKSA